MNGLLNSSDFISDSHAVRFSGSNFTSSGSGNFNMSGNATANGDTIRGATVDGSTINVTSGSVTITGDNYAGGYHPQAAYFTGSTIRSIGSGNISVSGTNYNSSTGSSAAIYSDSGMFENANGTIAINGISYDLNTTLTSYGVIHLGNSQSISVLKTGNVVISGSTPGNANGLGIYLDYGSTVNANGGLITLTANSLTIAGKVNATTTGNVLIQTIGAGVNLGELDNSANLGLFSAEIERITARLLTIGNSTTGAILTTVAISRSNATLGTTRKRGQRKRGHSTLI